MTSKHYTVKNALGGCFCKKCMMWSNMPDGLKYQMCDATKETAKENTKRLRAFKTSDGFRNELDSVCKNILGQ